NRVPGGPDEAVPAPAPCDSFLRQVAVARRAVPDDPWPDIRSREAGGAPERRHGDSREGPGGGAAGRAGGCTAAPTAGKRMARPYAHLWGAVELPRLHGAAVR